VEEGVGGPLEAGRKGNEEAGLGVLGTGVDGVESERLERSCSGSVKVSGRVRVLHFLRGHAVRTS
jgi:hypothetical protein